MLSESDQERLEAIRERQSERATASGDLADVDFLLRVIHDIKTGEEQVKDVFMAGLIAAGHRGELLERVDVLKKLGSALSESLEHCRACRECGDGPCCDDCGAQAALEAWDTDQLRYG